MVEFMRGKWVHIQYLGMVGVLSVVGIDVCLDRVSNFSMFGSLVCVARSYPDINNQNLQVS